MCRRVLSSVPGGVVITTDAPMKPLTVEDVRAAIDRMRR
jgi:hypothetical protein